MPRRDVLSRASRVEDHLDASFVGSFQKVWKRARALRLEFFGGTPIVSLGRRIGPRLIGFPHAGIFAVADGSLRVLPLGMLEVDLSGRHVLLSVILSLRTR
jgi:hypothetical protein